MAQECSLRMPDDFVLPLLPSEELKDKYRRYLFRDYVEVCVCLGMHDISFPYKLSANITAISAHFTCDYIQTTLSKTKTFIKHYFIIHYITELLHTMVQLFGSKEMSTFIEQGLN